jgi:DNA-binding FrmR family transcriptional regulator
VTDQARVTRKRGANRGLWQMPEELHEIVNALRQVAAIQE